MLPDAPLIDEIEISLFGPRRGYGESIVVHIGGGQWVVIDSCRHSINGKPAALAYLESIGVDAASSVQLIVASHWHSDHIDGLSTLFDQCGQAELACSTALNIDEMLTLDRAFRRSAPAKNKHGMEEFSRIISILLERSSNPHYRHFKPPKWAISKRPLLKITVSPNIYCIITALSPSDGSVLKAKQDIAKITDEYLREGKRSIISGSPNHNAIVLWIQIGEHNMLLGADLENTADPNTGWKPIIADFTTGSPTADVYKVAHHGSSTGDNQDIWEKLLTTNPYSLITPFVYGKHKLPTANDVKRIKSQTKKGFITIKPNSKHRKYNKAVKQMIGNATKRFSSRDNTIEYIRLRKNISSEPGTNDWSVKTSTNAEKL